MKTFTSKANEGGNIQSFILSVVGVAVVLAVGLIVLNNLQSASYTPSCSTQNFSVVRASDGTPTGCSNGTVTQNLAGQSLASNATGSVITQLATVPQWIGIIITVALAFIVLGYFYNRM